MSIKHVPALVLAAVGVLLATTVLLISVFALVGCAPEDGGR